MCCYQRRDFKQHKELKKNNGKKERYFFLSFHDIIMTALSRNDIFFMTANDLIRMWGIIARMEPDCLVLGLSLSS